MTSRRIEVAIVVSTPGNMARRADALIEHMPADIAATATVRPGPTALVSLARSADIVYVIDAGKSGFAAGVATWSLRRPVVFELGDPQAPLFRVQGRSPLAVAAGATIDRLVTRHASGIAVRGKELADILAIRRPWIELPDGVDLDRFRPGGGDDVRRRLGIPTDALVAGVIGNVGRSRRPGLGYGWDVVAALEHAADDRVVALVVGGGNGLDALRAHVAAIGLDARVFFAGAVPHDDVPSLIGAFDVCISTQTDDAVGRARTTAKLPEYLACDRFVLATDVGAASAVLPEEMRIPYAGSWDETYPRRLGERLVSLVPLRDELRAGAGTRSIAATLYAYPVLAARLAAFLHELVD